jgi:quinol monooxygenase YgiN
MTFGGKDMNTQTKYFAETQPDVNKQGENKNLQKERRMVRVILQHKSDDMEGLIDLLKEIRDEIMKFPGYITSEHLINADDPTNLVVISTWQNIDRWHNWNNSDICKNLMTRLSAKLKEPLKMTMFNYYVIREKRVWSTW